MVITENLETWKRTGTIIKINLNPTVVGNYWFHFQNPFLLLKNLWFYFWIHVFLGKQMSLCAPKGCQISVHPLCMATMIIRSKVNCVNAFSMKDIISLSYLLLISPNLFWFSLFCLWYLNTSNSWKFSCMQVHFSV